MARTLGGQIVFLVSALFCGTPANAELYYLHGTSGFETFPLDAALFAGRDVTARITAETAVDVEGLYPPSLAFNVVFYQWNDLENFQSGWSAYTQYGQSTVYNKPFTFHIHEDATTVLARAEFFQAWSMSLNSYTVTMDVRAPNVVVTPLPGAAVLFGSGLGLLGLVMWRRKRLSRPPTRYAA